MVTNHLLNGMVLQVLTFDPNFRPGTSKFFHVTTRMVKIEWQPWEGEYNSSIPTIGIDIPIHTRETWLYSWHKKDKIKTIDGYIDGDV